MARYEIADSLLINAGKNALYQAVIAEVEGKTSWSFPYLKFVSVDGMSCEKVGSTRWLYVRFPGRPKMLAKTEATIPGELIAVRYIDGDFVGTGSFSFEDMDGGTAVTFRWKTDAYSLLFSLGSHAFPVATAHSCLVKGVLNNLADFMKMGKSNMNGIPPHMRAEDKVILFDGVCRLCNAWSRFIIRFDRENVFKLASVQSPQGQAILQHFGLPTDYFETMLFVEGNMAYAKSTAFLNIVRLLPWPFNWLSAFRVVPKPIRDWCYDRIALNRYALFGRYDSCLLPTPDHDQRFL